MYSKESLSKVIKLMNESKAHYMGKDVADIKMAISKGNRKIGRTMNVSLPPILTCANCSGCMKLCYDIKACLQYPNTVIDARMRNYAILMKDRKASWTAITSIIWYQSRGDIQTSFSGPTPKTIPL